jgi:hypothetical protein
LPTEDENTILRTTAFGIAGAVDAAVPGARYASSFMLYSLIAVFVEHVLRQLARHARRLARRPWMAADQGLC